MTDVAGVDEPKFSPNGRWVAYSGAEPGGAVQVYVIPFPATGQRFQASIDGGSQPRWRGDGRELFFMAPNGTVMSSGLPDGDVRRAGTPVALFDAGLEASNSFDQFAPSADGQRFLIRRPADGGGDRAPVHLIVNFDPPRAFAEARLRPRLP